MVGDGSSGAVLNIAALSGGGEAHSFSWPDPSRRARLRQSIRDFGLLVPLLVMEDRSGVAVVAGRRRLEVLVELGVASVPVRWARAADAEGLWDLLLEEQLLGGPLNPVEVGLYARKRMAATGEDPETVARRALPRMGLPARPGALRDAIWISELPDCHKDGFAEGRFPAQGVRVLVNAPREDALAVMELLGQARLGANKFTEVARWLLECAWKEGLSVETWASREGLRPWRGGAEELRLELRRRRFPTVSAWESSFRTDAAKAGLPDQVRLSHPPGFEGGHLGCTFTFSSVKDLEALVHQVGDALRDGRLAPLEKYTS